MTDIHEINDLVDFLCEKEITTKQLVYCLLLHHDKKYGRKQGTAKIVRPLSQLYKYYTNIEQFTRSELQDLIDKGLLIKNGEKFKPDQLEVTDRFVKDWYGDKYKFEGLEEVYPKWVPNFNNPSGPDVNLMMISDRQKLMQTYNSLVKTYKMHNRVLAVVQWAKERDLIKVGIEKFVHSKHWEDLIELRDKDEQMTNYTNI